MTQTIQAQREPLREGARPSGSDAQHGGVLPFLAGVARGWDRFWFRPADPTTLGAIRLLAGLLVFYVHLSYSWGLLDFVGPGAWLNDSTATDIRFKQEYPLPSLTWDEPSKESVKGNPTWSIFYHIKDPPYVVALHACFLAAMLLFALGLWTRYTSVLAWVGAMSYVQRASNTVFGMDTMMMIVLFYLMLGPSGEALSLDRLWQLWRARREGRESPSVEPSVMANFAIRLIQVHFCLIYLAGGTSKLLGNTWWAGTALNLVLLNYSFAPLSWGPYRHLMEFLGQHRILWELMATGGVLYTLVLEIGFPFLVWDRRWRWVMVSGSILLHTGIGLSMGLLGFSLFMMTMVLSFVPPEAVRQVVDTLEAGVRQLLGRSRPPREKKELVLSGLPGGRAPA